MGTAPTDQLVDPALAYNAENEAAAVKADDTSRPSTGADVAGGALAVSRIPRLGQLSQ